MRSAADMIYHRRRDGITNSALLLMKQDFDPRIVFPKGLGTFSRSRCHATGRNRR
jgi:hypothetical protein